VVFKTSPLHIFCRVFFGKPPLKFMRMEVLEVIFQKLPPKTKFSLLLGVIYFKPPLNDPGGY
jgi:hypothetical protein